MKNSVASDEVEAYHIVAVIETGQSAAAERQDTDMKKILVENIEDAMVLGREVCGAGGNVLLTKGTVLSKALGRRLQNWGIPSVYVEGEEEQLPAENTVTVSPEDLDRHLTAKFGSTIKNLHMKKIFEAVYEFRLHKLGK